jgi:hypothetical protein
MGGAGLMFPMRGYKEEDLVTAQFDFSSGTITFSVGTTPWPSSSFLPSSSTVLINRCNNRQFFFRILLKNGDDFDPIFVFTKTVFNFYSTVPYTVHVHYTLYTTYNTYLRTYPIIINHDDVLIS